MSHESNKSLKIHAEIAAKLNFASRQSSHALLHDLRVENLHEDQLQENLILIMIPHDLLRAHFSLEETSRAYTFVAVTDREQIVRIPYREDNGSNIYYFWYINSSMPY